jgi:hypothetical protein
MSQPPVPGPGPGAEPARRCGLPGGPAGVPGPRRDPDRDLRLGDFAAGGAGDTCPPGPDLAAAAAGLSGPGWRCPGATDEELTGLLGRWAALESWAAAGKLGAIRELIRRRGVPGAGSHRDLPDLWADDLSHEIAPALGTSLPAADKLASLAWELGARLPGIAAALAAGVIDYTKAQLITKELTVLDDAHIAQAEALILPELAGKTAGQLIKLAALAVVTVDPEGARKRREHAEREEARIRIWREHTGASALAAYGLPTDAALAAQANINLRAGQYKKANMLPGARMDQLRVLAFLDILNDISADTRIAQAQADGQPPGSGGPADEHSTSGTGGGASGDKPAGTGSDNDGPGDDDSGGGNGAAAALGTGGPGPVLSANSNLTLPLVTLLGLAERPGMGHGLGALDPALVRGLAATAARSPHSEWCVTITDANGYAIGHGCAKPVRKGRGKAPPARNRDGPWAFTRHDDPGPPGGLGTWNLTFPDGRQFTVKLGPIPVADCDHRHESASYQPGDTLRHLVEIRDGECTFPPCSRHARNCDFEHATPYHHGGRTCACNAGARSRRCHRVKQSNGWKVTQPRPGWHQWTTPSGRTYTQGPMKYPA